LNRQIAEETLVILSPDKVKDNSPSDKSPSIPTTSYPVNPSLGEGDPRGEIEPQIRSNTCPEKGSQLSGDRFPFPAMSESFLPAYPTPERDNRLSSDRFHSPASPKSFLPAYSTSEKGNQLSGGCSFSTMPKSVLPVYSISRPRGEGRNSDSNLPGLGLL
jgi:hypothetical protein